MKVTKTEVIISILIVLIIASITFLIPKPKLSQGCGDCTPWENGSCGLEAGCQIGEMKQGRECIGDIFSDEKPTHAGQGDDIIPLSPPREPQYSLGDVPPECIKRCVPMPEVCNTPPEQPINLYPENTSADIPVTENLSWEAYDIDEQELFYDIYLDTNQEVQNLVSENQNGTEYTFQLEYSTVYYWKIIVNDSYNITESQIWSFTTENTEVPLDEPENGGPSSGNGDAPNECNNNEITCQEDILVICLNEKWEVVQVCENDCLNSACVEEPLFDIKVTLNENSENIHIEDKVEFNIVLYNFGTLNPVDVFLQCSLEDFEKNKLDFFEETLAVDLQTSINRNLKFPQETKSGTYVISCYLTYKDETISSSELVNILEKPHEEHPKEIIDFNLILYLAILLVFIITIIIFINKRKKTKPRRKKIGNRKHRTTKTTHRKHKKNR